MRSAVAVGVALAVAACTGPTPGSLTPPPTPTADASAVASMAAAGRAGRPPHCTAHDGLPDTACTPGAVNPDVTQDTIGATICRRGWTKTVRPPLAYTSALKRRQIAEYGSYAGTSLRGYEEDHLIPLELGGAPRDPLNLWPQQGATPNPKDAVEDAGRRAVCAHRITLDAARLAIAKDWRAFGRSVGVPVANPTGQASQ